MKAFHYIYAVAVLVGAYMVPVANAQKIDGELDLRAHSKTQLALTTGARTSAVSDASVIRSGLNTGDVTASSYVRQQTALAVGMNSKSTNTLAAVVGGRTGDLNLRAYAKTTTALSLGARTSSCVSLASVNGRVGNVRTTAAVGHAFAFDSSRWA